MCIGHIPIECVSGMRGRLFGFWEDENRWKLDFDPVGEEGMELLGSGVLIFAHYNFLLAALRTQLCNAMFHRNQAHTARH